MKITCILGSPHTHGNTATILDEIVRPFIEQGYDVTRYCLGSSNVQYCLGCRSCYENGQCVQNDDVEIIMKSVLESALVIVASPSYWGDVTGQMKVFIDRCTPYCNVRYKECVSELMTKGVAVAVRAGRNKEENENLIKTIEHFLGHLDIPLISSFTVESVDVPEDLIAKPEITNSAFTFGKSVIELLED